MIVGERLGSRRKQNKSIEISAFWVKIVYKGIKILSAAQMAGRFCNDYSFRTGRVVNIDADRAV